MNIPLSVPLRTNTPLVNILDASVTNTSNGAIINLSRLNCELYKAINNIASIKISFKDDSVWDTSICTANIKFTIEDELF